MESAACRLRRLTKLASVWSSMMTVSRYAPRRHCHLLRLAPMAGDARTLIEIFGIRAKIRFLK
uniref:Uncharacterized protein n=1 Tax=Oryza rufipogon TaxID=4529 RepID=A0A0E0QU04_ORYRU